TDLKLLEVVGDGGLLPAQCRLRVVRAGGCRASDEEQGWEPTGGCNAHGHPRGTGGRPRMVMIREGRRVRSHIRLGEGAGNPDSMAGALPTPRNDVFPQGASHAALEFHPAPGARTRVVRP